MHLLLCSAVYSDASEHPLLRSGESSQGDAGSSKFDVRSSLHHARTGLYEWIGAHSRRRSVTCRLALVSSLSCSPSFRVCYSFRCFDARVPAANVHHCKKPSVKSNKNQWLHCKNRLLQLIEVIDTRARNRIELSNNSTRIDSIRPNRVGSNWIFEKLGRIESDRITIFEGQVESDRIELTWMKFVTTLQATRVRNWSESVESVRPESDRMRFLENSGESNRTESRFLESMSNRIGSNSKWAESNRSELKIFDSFRALVITENRLRLV